MCMAKKNAFQVTAPYSMKINIFYFIKILYVDCALEGDFFIKPFDKIKC